MSRWLRSQRTPGQDTRYAFAVGRIRALEARLLDSARIDRLLDADDAEEALRILSDSEYGGLVAELAQATQFESILTAEEDRLWRLFNELCLDGWLRDLILSRLDYANLKVLSRLRLILKSEEPWSAREGGVAIDVLSEALTERTPALLPDHLASAVGVLLDSESAGRLSPRQTDLVLDHAYFAFLLQQAQDHGTTFFIQFVRVWIDLVNIETFFRMRYFRPDLETVRLAFHNGGTIPVSHFLALLDEPPEVLGHRFYATAYFSLVEHGSAALEATGSFSRLEKLLDDYLIDFVRRTKVYPFGSEPLIAYLLAKEHELKMLRMIFMAKTVHIREAALKHRMPEVY
jgi:V/A-type H+-transporting ATPase subunit C